MTRPSPRALLLASAAILSLPAALAPQRAAGQELYFERVATLPVFRNLPAGTDPATQTVAEIIAATPDGTGLVYTDSPGRAIGFLDIADPAAPRPAGRLALDGEPTSVAVSRGAVLVGVNTSESYVSPSGHVAVIDADTRAVAARCDVGGQPDSVAVSPDGAHLAVVVENERDEDLNGGALPQAPSGHLAILDLGADGRPTNCDAARIVALAGLADIAPEDAEPEYVDINADNLAVVTLQENNHIVLVDLAAGSVAGHFPAGAVDLAAIDTATDGTVAGTGAKAGLKREPDAVAWIDADRFVTANEGDYEGGSRGFTIFDRSGAVLYDAGNSVEHLAMRHGHYPEKRAKAKGVEPEGIEVGSFGGDRLIFVGAERANFVAVYRDRGAGADPAFVQFLPTGVGPEGLLAIPGRDLFVVATEEDSAEDNVRATVSIYARTAAAPSYPMVVSDTDPATGAPIGWGALSGLAADPQDASRVYAVSDSAYRPSRIYALDVAASPARIRSHVDLTRDGEPAAYDLEGIALRRDGGFWLVSEGNPDKDLANLLIAVAADGTVLAEIPLPPSVASQAIRFGFEGVASWDDDGVERVVVAIQREWKDDPAHQVKLAVYTPSDESWGFVGYPIAAPSSPNGGWVGLSEITHLGGGRFALIERDNQPGPHAAFKAITTVSLAGVTPAAAGIAPPVVERKVAIDLLPAMRAGNGWISDKPEGFAVTAGGELLVVIDNDGVDDATGETQLLRLGKADLLD